MKRPGPLLTLLVGLLLGIALLSLDATSGGEGTASAPRRPSPSATPASAPATSTPPPSPTPSRTPVPDADYAGRTADDTAAVAVTVRDRKAIAYFCDGRTRESWLEGDVADDGSMRLTGRDGSSLDGTLEGADRISGTVDAGGDHHVFTADRAARRSRLWRATGTVRGARIDGGWIVLKDGTQVGVVTRDGTTSSAPRIDPETGAVTVDGERLTARPVTP
ncbi:MULTISPECIES: hypothetical protein [unclassified Streptomyces]|uniref:hypothetical protein n=1 Tax=unclassified Streptomyces TaxID=2593676 RepID=UPI001F04006E|nr:MULTISPECIES: hypothetical protein [unclassified Streptomyces]MCH0567156.1 hypothetical protein [Streptomyces sp. MUM 2J]MCH0572735.1 hypothetical protein [Streptomyces sp. MUM 136J]